MDRRSFVKTLLAGTAASAFGGARYSRGAEFVLNARNAPKGGKVLIKGGSLITMYPAVPDLAGSELAAVDHAPS